MSDYERIASVIRYLNRNHADQPDLTKLAKHVGLSPYHFHRLFSAWAGITPKDFLQCLTLSHAKQLLQNGKTVLDTTLDAGLSSPSRLHDLCVSLEAASPGEIKLGGAGLIITVGFADSPFGKCLIGENCRGICHLSFIEAGKEFAPATSALKIQWPHAKLQRDDRNANKLSSYIFKRSVTRLASNPLRVFVKGTPFQVRVWQALLQIPPGAVVNYGGLATAIGRPTAARAVGSALSKNPLAYLIPCHRVIRETGAIGYYRWGQIRKRAILTWENPGNFKEIDGCRPVTALSNLK